MTTEYSSLLWDNIRYLWYLQFPWRFLTFVAFFISVVGGYSIFFLSRLLEQYIQFPRLDLHRSIVFLISFLLIGATIFIYQKYFKPERLISTSDQEKTAFEEIAWRTSRTSYEFVPKGVKTKKSSLNTTILAIDKSDLPQKSYEIISGKAYVYVTQNKFANKKFYVNAITPLKFRLNTYNFIGWKGYLDGKKIPTNDSNDLRLITVDIPQGKHDVKFVFEDTTVRKISNLMSLFSAVFIVLLFFKFKKIDS